MNIFRLHDCPIACSMLMCDRHVVKMILETAQLLSTAHVVIDGVQVAYKKTHENHPSAIWVRESRANYEWAYDHLVALIDEHQHRYPKSKVHATSRYLDALCEPPKGLTGDIETPLRLAIAHPFIHELYSDDPVQAYRTYYSLYKRTFKDGKAATWTNRDIPSWF